MNISIYTHIYIMYMYLTDSLSSGVSETSDTKKRFPERNVYNKECI